MSKEVRRDSLPEGYHYQDRGCDLAPSCLNCPFDKCVEDGGKRHFLKEQRGREIARVAKGKSIKELSLMFDVSKRTINRALRGR